MIEQAYTFPPKGPITVPDIVELNATDSTLTTINPECSLFEAAIDCKSKVPSTVMEFH
jgi:hypothetical protein